jgi:hypothetical protein
MLMLRIRPVAIRRLAGLLSALMLAACSSESATQRARPQPGLGPMEVVQHQVRALGNNARWGNDQGIKRAYRFASSANRDAFGPFPRFADMLRNPGYRPLLDNREARYSEPVFDDGRAAVAVTIITLAGRRVDYVFFLSRSNRDGCQRCWLTDAVHPGPDHPPDPAPRVTL